MPIAEAVLNAIMQEVHTHAARHATAEQIESVTWRRWGGGPPLVLLHGYGGSWTHWIRNVLPLSRHFMVLAPDLPGHGDSGLPAGDVSCAAFASLLWRGVDGLAGAGAQVALAGFSFGSLLAESMAMQQPARVRQVLLLRGSFAASAPGQPPQLLRWRGVDHPQQLARIHRHNLAASMFHDPDRIDAAALDLHADNVARCRLDARALLASRQMEAYTSLRCAVHGIAGEFDVYGGGDVAAQGEALRRILPHATFDLVPGAGHWAAYEAAREVNAMMLRALVREPRR